MPKEPTQKELLLRITEEVAELRQMVAVMEGHLERRDAIIRMIMSHTRKLNDRNMFLLQALGLKTSLEFENDLKRQKAAEGMASAPTSISGVGEASLSSAQVSLRNLDAAGHSSNGAN